MWSKIPQRYWGYLSLVVWGAICFALLGKMPYGIDEGAAQALLLVWSVVDGVVSPVVTLGFPDFRAVFLVPFGFLWPGSVVAGKVTSILIAASMVWAYFQWLKVRGETEVALVGTGLLLISPLLIAQVDSIAVSLYLLLAFVLGAWADRHFRASPLAFGGMYFSQLFLCLMSVTLHPIGLAYPLMLAWSWYKNPVNEKQQKYFFVGIAFIVAFALLLTLGWRHVSWLQNPIAALTGVVYGANKPAEFGVGSWLLGIAVMGTLAWVVARQAKQMWQDALGRTHLIALAIGLLVGDETFAMLALVTLLYWGLPLLMRSVEGGFWRQRGWAMSVIVVMCMMSMLSDRVRYDFVSSGTLSARDMLIKSFTENRDVFPPEQAVQPTETKKVVRVASQWPGLTMLACQCDALPLPPEVKDGEALFNILHGINYLLFDPHAPINGTLSHNLASMSSEKFETLEVQFGGVLIKVKGAPISAPPASDVPHDL